MLIPSEVIARTENPRTEEQEPAPYARVPASAESVNDRVVYGDLPDEVEIYDTDGDFFFVTVSAPDQSVLSWLIGSADPVVDLLTEEGKNGRRTPVQNREIALQQMRTATQEAQFVALTAAGYEPTIEFGSVVVQDILCRETADDGFTCDEEFPSAEVLQPADTILEVDGMPITTIEDLTAALDGAEPGDVVEMTIDRAREGTHDRRRRAVERPDRSRPDHRRLRPVRHPDRRPALRRLDRHRRGRGAVGRRGVHARVDRRVDRGRPDRRA